MNYLRMPANHRLKLTAPSITPLAGLDLEQQALRPRSAAQPERLTEGSMIDTMVPKWFHYGTMEVPHAKHNG